MKLDCSGNAFAAEDSVKTCREGGRILIVRIGFGIRGQRVDGDDPPAAGELHRVREHDGRFAEVAADLENRAETWIECRARQRQPPDVGIRKMTLEIARKRDHGFNMSYERVDWN